MRMEGGQGLDADRIKPLLLVRTVASRIRGTLLINPGGQADLG
jgi:hypothetical protein